MINHNAISPRPLVQLELDLEQQVGDLNAAESRALAAKLVRWAHQLQVKASVLESHALPQPKRSLRRLCERQLRLN
jgi:hypothetical protein